MSSVALKAEAESLYEEIASFVDGSAAGLVQLLVAAARKTTFARILACPTYPAPVRSSGLTQAVDQFRTALQRSELHAPTLLARLYGSTQTFEQRKRAGQFFTAQSVAEWALRVEAPRESDDVCDAGAGAAVFADAIVRSGRPVRSYVGVENDAVLALCAAHALESIDAPRSFRVWYANFLLLKESAFAAHGLRTPSFVIANPPFVRSHRLGGRARLLATVKASLGLSLSPYSGSGSYFLSRAAALTESAPPPASTLGSSPRMLFFFPREAAGAAHSRRLRADLRQIHGWGCREHAITDIQTGIDKHPSNALALLFVFERKKAVSEPHVPRFNSEVRVRDILEIKRGISTGCNSFFVLTDEAVRQRKISKRFLKAVLPTRIPIKSARFSLNDWDELRRTGHACWLLVLPAGQVEDFDAAVREYLREGIRRGVHDTPTAKKLRAWFSLPIPRTPPDVFVTYLFRGAPRFVLNTSSVLHLTNILGGRFSSLIQDPVRRALVVDRLNTQAQHWMDSTSVGREYRGGLKKIEPRELSMLTVDSGVVDISGIRTAATSTSNASLFDDLANPDI